MATIEQIYQAQIDAMLPKQRVERSMAMFHWMRETLARQIVAGQGPMSPERLRLEVARRMYMADPQALALIERKLAEHYQEKQVKRAIEEVEQ